MSTPGTIPMDYNSPLAIRLRTAGAFIDRVIADEPPMNKIELVWKARADSSACASTVSIILHSRISEGKLKVNDLGLLERPAQ